LQRKFSRADTAYVTRRKLLMSQEFECDGGLLFYPTSRRERSAMRSIFTPALVAWEDQLTRGDWEDDDLAAVLCL
jgi:hypothetical protein